MIGYRTKGDDDHHAWRPAAEYALPKMATSLCAMMLCGLLRLLKGRTGFHSFIGSSLGVQALSVECLPWRLCSSRLFFTRLNRVAARFRSVGAVIIHYLGSSDLCLVVEIQRLWSSPSENGECDSFKNFGGAPGKLQDTSMRACRAKFCHGG